MESKKYLRITLDERRHIERGLKQGESIRRIAASLGRHPSTVSREIVRNSVHRQAGGFGTPFNNCANRDLCGESKLCGKEGCRRRLCRGCRLCPRVCRLYERESCPGLSRPPYVCDGCPNRRACPLEKAFYDAKAAHRSAAHVLRSSRDGLNVTPEELLRLDGIVTPLVQKGQSPWHIANTQKDLLMVSDKTLYAYIAANLLTASSTDLARKVKMKPRKARPHLKVERACREGRSYRDFLRWLEENPDTEVVQMDTVIGAKGGGEKVLLTIHFPQSRFMLAFLRDANTARSVEDAFARLRAALGFNRFEELFPVILTDNGSEFSHPSAIETDGDGLLWTRVFYCDPNCPYQKGSIESNHRLLRAVLPKGGSFNRLTQDDVDVLMSHVNSYARKSLGGLSPFSVFARIHGNMMAGKLGVSLIPASEVNLTPGLLR